MVAVVNMESIAERFGDIDSAKLTLPVGQTVSYNVDYNDDDLHAEPNVEDHSVSFELVQGRQIIANPTFDCLAGGLLAATTHYKGLYSELCLTEVTLRGQVGGVYAVYNFKAV